MQPMPVKANFQKGIDHFFPGEQHASIAQKMVFVEPLSPAATATLQMQYLVNAVSQLSKNQQTLASSLDKLWGQVGAIYSFFDAYYLSGQFVPGPSSRLADLFKR
jgi:hypothetical protein